MSYTNFKEYINRRVKTVCCMKFFYQIRPIFAVAKARAMLWVAVLCTSLLCLLTRCQNTSLCLHPTEKVRSWGKDLYISSPSQMEVVHRLAAPPGPQGLSSSSCLSNILAVKMADLGLTCLSSQSSLKI